MKFLIYGHKGFLGKEFVELVQKTDKYVVILGQSRVDDDEAVEKEINTHIPDRVISLAGRVRGGDIKTADYLEQADKLTENMRDNLYGPLNLAIICKSLKIHLTYLGTGCIFDNGCDEKIKFTENDKPNFYGSSYSIVKGFTDRLLHKFESDVLNVRIRMPTIDKEHPLNFITKLAHYSNICSNPNSITVLSELYPMMLDMIVRKVTGTINLTNPGVITHNEILEMYKEIIDPNHTWKNITLEEQDKILKSKRSNNHLDTSRLESMYPEIMSIKVSIRKCMEKLKENMQGK
jgi:dTDP-4-dehydrorhamnose reductase